MERREFLAKSCAAGVAAVSGGALWAQGSLRRQPGRERGGLSGPVSASSRAQQRHPGDGGRRVGELLRIEAV